MKIPFYRSVFWRMIAAVSFSFLAILSGSFAFLYASVSDSLKERTDAEKIQSFRQLQKLHEALFPLFYLPD